MAKRYARSNATRMAFTSHLPGAGPPRDRHPGSKRASRLTLAVHGQRPGTHPEVDPRIHASGDAAGASLGCERRQNRPTGSQRNRPQATRWGARCPAAGARRDASGRPSRPAERSSRSPRGCACDGPRSATAQADSLARPLRRRFAKMARPARVRMRRRKPCLRARRRLLGWYVRLLTSGSSRRGWSHLRRSFPDLGSPCRMAPMRWSGNELSTATARSQIYVL
jgi:hypothetical protein